MPDLLLPSAFAPPAGVLDFGIDAWTWRPEEYEPFAGVNGAAVPNVEGIVDGAIGSGVGSYTYDNAYNAGVGFQGATFDHTTAGASAWTRFINFAKPSNIASTCITFTYLGALPGGITTLMYINQLSGSGSALQWAYNPGVGFFMADKTGATTGTPGAVPLLLGQKYTLITMVESGMQGYRLYDYNNLLLEERLNGVSPNPLYMDQMVFNSDSGATILKQKIAKVGYSLNGWAGPPDLMPHITKVLEIDWITLAAFTKSFEIDWLTKAALIKSLTLMWLTDGTTWTEIIPPITGYTPVAPVTSIWTEVPRPPTTYTP